MSRIQWISITLTGVLTASACVAAEKEAPLPKDLPPYGETKPYRLPAVEKLKLDNGLTVWLAPLTGFPKVSVAAAVRGGYAVDPKDRAGMADLLAATLSQGTNARNARQIAEVLQGCGGDLNVQADADGISLETSVLSEKVQTALDVVGDVLLNANFPDHEVDIAKQNAASTLEVREGEPEFLANRALHKAIFGDHPYSVTAPTKESIANTTASELKQEYRRRFRPDEAVLVVVGDFDQRALAAQIKKGFGGWSKPATASDVAVPTPPSNITKSAFYVPRPHSVQTALYIGGLAPTLGQKDFEAATLANAIYGGMFGSRLILNIREDKGYTYSPDSYVAPYVKSGMLVTRADVRNAVTGASFNEITYELNRVATTTPESEELIRAKRYVIGSMAIRLQGQLSLARALAQYWGRSLTPEDLARRSERIEKVTAEEVQQAGRTYFPMWRMTTVAVGEEKVIKDELSPFGLEFKKADAGSNVGTK
jgi:zinc protease